MQNSSPSKHAIWSPSSSEKWVNCPSSVKMESGFPNESSTYSDEGTAAHFLASYCLLLSQKPSDHLDRHVLFFVDEDGQEHVDWFIPVAENGREHIPGSVRNRVLVTQEMVDNINLYMFEAGYAKGDDGELLIEQQLSIGHITGEEDAAGTADLVVLKPGELQVRDLKYGKGVLVEAKGNKQLLLYALAAYDKYKDHAMFILDEIRTVTVAIHQPRLNHLDEWTMSVEELLKYRAMYVYTARISRDVLGGDAPVEKYLEAGLHCSKGFCRAQAVCPALKQFVLDSCGFEDVTDGMKDLDLTADDLGDSKSRIPILQAWIKKVEEETFKRLERGDPVTGYKLAMGREGNRTWADEQQAVAQLSTLGYTLDQLYVKSLKSPTRMKDDLKIPKKRFEELGGLISRAPAGKIVVPEDDTRPAPSNTDGFDNLEEK